MEIESAIDAFVDAIERTGLPAVPAPEPIPDFEALEAELAPLTIPAEVKTFWSRVNPGQIAAVPYVSLLTAEDSLQVWSDRKREFPHQYPVVLLDLGLDGHLNLSVELGDDAEAGGAIFMWDLVDSQFDEVAGSLGEWLAGVTGLISSGNFEWSADKTTLWIPRHEDDDSWPEAVGRVAASFEDWPARWQRHHGISGESVEPRGASHSIAEIIAIDPGDEVHATIVGEVVSIVGVGGATRADVSDGSESVEVFCGADVMHFGPVIRERFEFDVVSAPGDSEFAALAVRKAAP